MKGRFSLCAGWLLLAASCKDHPATGIVLALSSDLRVPDQASQLSVRVLRDATPRYHEDFPLAPGKVLPGTLSLERDGNDGPITVEIAMGQPGQTPQVTRVAKLKFVDEKTKLLRVRMSVACIGKVCDPSLTCDAGKCIPPEIDGEALPGYESDEEALDPTGCFDPKACTAAPVALVNASSSDECAFVAPTGAFHVGLRWASDASQVVLVAKGEGWSEEGGVVKLLGGACEGVKEGRATAYGVERTGSCGEYVKGQALCVGAPVVDGVGGAGGVAGAAGVSGSSGQSGAAGVGGESGQGGAGQSGASGQGGAGQSGAGQGGAGMGGAGGGGAGGMSGGSGQGGAGMGGQGGAGEAGMSGSSGHGGGPLMLTGPAPNDGAVMGFRTSCAWGKSGQSACWGFYSSFFWPADVGTIMSIEPHDTGLTDVRAMVTGDQDYVCALQGDGTVRCWGQDFCPEQVKDCKLEPNVIPDVQGAVALSGGLDSACALLPQGQVKCWGNNKYGTVGNNSSAPVRTPFTVPIGPARAIWGRRVHCATIDASGEVVCWDSTTPMPQVIVGVNDPAQVISAFDTEGMLFFRTKDGKLMAARHQPMSGWGQASEVVLPPKIGKIEQIDAWSDRIGLLDDKGVLWVARPTLSTGTVKDEHYEPAGLPPGVASFTLGSDGEGASNVCAYVESNEVPPKLSLRCRGGDRYGELGTGKPADVLSPVPVDTSSVISGLYSQVMTTTNNTIFVANDTSQGKVFGCGKMSSTSGLSELTELGPNAGINPGVLAVFDPGLIYIQDLTSPTWQSFDEHGALQTGNKLLSDITQIAEIESVGHFDLALTKDKKVYARTASATSDNLGGRLGTSMAGDRKAGDVVPVDLEPLNGSTVNAIATGSDANGDFTTQCLLDESNALYCWGFNTSGQVGVDMSQTTVPIPTRVLVNGGDAQIRQMAPMSHGVCVLTIEGDVYCWGVNDVGQLGRVAPSPSAVPTKIEGLEGIEGLRCGGSHCCAWRGNDLRCWGWNAYGQLGNNNRKEQFTPVAINVPVTVSETIEDMTMRGRGNTSCLKMSTGKVLCWGENYWGQTCVQPAGRDTATDTVKLPWMP